MAGRPPRGRPPTTPTARSPHRACRPGGQCWAPTPTHPRPQHVGGRPQQPTQWAAVGGGGAPDLRRPSRWWKAPPPGRPVRHPHSEQRRPARAHAVEPVLGPHARTDRTWNTRVAVPRLPAPEDGRSGEGKRLTPDAPHNSGRPAPPGDGPQPHHPLGPQPPQGMQAKRTVLGPHTLTIAPTARGQRIPTARPVGGQSGEGERLTSDAPRNNSLKPGRGEPGPDRPPPTTPSPWPAAPTGHAGQGDSFGPPHPYNRAHSTWAADSNSPPSGRAVGGGGAPDLRRPSQQQP